MGLMDFIKGEFIDVIEWTDDSRDTLCYRFPDEDKAIKNGAQLIVRESQVAQFMYLGQFGDTFGPGKHSLTTDNIPVLTKLQSWKYLFNSPFKADVFYVTTRLFTGNKWGTANPVMVRDDDFGIVRLRAFGTFDFKIINTPLFIKEVAGSDHHFRLDEFADTMRSRMVSVFSEALASAKVPVLDVATRYSELGEALLPVINPVVGAKYGLEIGSFIIENVSLPPEVEQAIDKRSSMTAIGNLNDYVKYQMGKNFGEGGAGAADNPDVMYSDAVYADKAGRLVAVAWSNQAAAGTWAANPTEVKQAPFHLERVGEEVVYMGGTVPYGFLACDGSNISRATYAKLFAKVGTTWGVGDGATTFGLPDSRRRVAVGSGGAGTGTLGNAVGNTGGEETHVLTLAESPAHTHLVGAAALTSGNAAVADHFAGNAQVNSSSAGGDGAHNNMQPSMVVTKMIRWLGDI